MPASTAFAQKLAAMIFNRASIANFTDETTSGPLTDLFLSLHTASPGAGGTAQTNEVSYAGYVRKAVARSTGQWNVSAGVASLVNDQNFPVSTGGTGGTVTHWAVSETVSGPAEIVAFGTVTSSIAIVATTTPSLNAGTAVTIA